MKTSEEIKNIINNGFALIKEEASKCGAKFECADDDKDGILDDDDQFLSFTTSIRCMEFMTDDGEIKPDQVTFELTYDRSEDEFTMAIGEDQEYPITYGNVMAYMYFNTLTVSA